MVQITKDDMKPRLDPTQHPRPNIKTMLAEEAHGPKQPHPACPKFVPEG